MNHDNLARAIAVRMRVFLSRTSVSCTSSVADAIATMERFEPDHFFQIAQFSFRAPDLQLVSIARNRNTSRVIAAILESSQALDDNRDHFFLADISDNATHAGTPGVQSAKEQRNSSMTGFVSTSRAIRSTSVCASSRLKPPSRVSSKYFP